MIDWEAVPPGLWGYLAATALNAAILIVRVSQDEQLHRKVEFSLIAVLVFVVWDYFLLRRVRWLWIGTIALLTVVTVAETIAGRILWWALVFSVIQFVLLLLPRTRRYFERRSAGVL